MRFVPTELRPQLYRCYIVWNASIPVIVLPIILYIADIGMPPHRPQPRSTLNAIFGASFSDRDRGNLYPVARRREYCIQPEARANHKLILRLHSRLECCLHRCVPYCICRWRGQRFDIFPSVCSRLVRAYRVPHLADPEADARRQDGLQPPKSLRYCH
jgi:hypothetical protein